MSSLILLRRVRVENANAIAGLTWGFPAITHFLGFAHALSRRLTETHGLRIEGCAVVSHEHQILAHTSGRDYQFALTRNPLTREAKTASFNEEGRMHMTVSLLLECHGEIPNGEYGQRDLAEYLSQVCPTLRLAGGIVVDIETITVMAMPSTDREMRRLQWQLMPGFALRDRSSWLVQHYQTLLENHPDATLLDAWLDFATLKIQAEMPESGNLRIGDVVVDVAAHEVRRGSEVIALTPLEFELLVALASKPQQVFSREMLLEQVWGYHYKADTRLVNVHVQRLRAKVEIDPDNPKIVMTVRGVGYRAGAVV